MILPTLIASNSWAKEGVSTMEGGIKTDSYAAVVCGIWIASAKKTVNIIDFLIRPKASSFV
jgi:hypothetical protein